MRDEALAYAKYGWSVFPVWDGAKTPATSSGVKAATTNRPQIGLWWADRDYNIGIATGQASGIVVVDVDRIPAIEELRDQGLEFPRTATVRTPKGVHLYFQAPEGGLRNSASKLAKGIDVRGDGGYVLAPPSEVGGDPYYWMDHRVPVPLPDWVLEKLTAPRDRGGTTPFAERPPATAAPR